MLQWRRWSCVGARSTKRAPALAGRGDHGAEPREKADGCGRVCHVTSVHPLDDVRIVRKEVGTLLKAGYDVWVVGTEGRTRADVGARFVTVPKDTAAGSGG
ncbi:MAG: hypothetical protein KatS3mg082_2499 [Nitrospiraceae bacterium]|nr:MAG: hypothetical protein KatS3mg082_2499 [Nitrospiraceae bacterium]